MGVLITGKVPKTSITLQQNLEVIFFFSFMTCHAINLGYPFLKQVMTFYLKKYYIAFSRVLSAILSAG